MCGIYLSLHRDGSGHCGRPSRYIQDALEHRGPDSVRTVEIEVVSQAKAIAARRDSPLETDLVNQCSASISITCTSSVLSLRGHGVTEQPVASTARGRDTDHGSFLCWNGEAWSFAGCDLRRNDSAHVFDVLSHVSATSWDLNDQSPEYGMAEAMAAYAGPFAFAFYDHKYKRLYFGRDFLGRRSLVWRLDADERLVLSSVPDADGEWQEAEADGVHWVRLDDWADGRPLCPRKTSYCFSDRSPRSSRSSSLCELELQRTFSSQVTQKSVSMRVDVPNPVDAIHHLLARSVSTRLVTIPGLLRAEQATAAPRIARVGTLFSGGIDCTLLARLSHDILDIREPIDLLNVAFENPRLHKAARASGESPYDQCPDRKTAHSSLNELREVCPGRTWRLVRINIPYTEFIEHRSAIIALITPHSTEMDLSIAAALYFAARGIGLDESGEAYSTPARVLLSGLGADELFGGYTRHATAFSRGGLAGLEDELALDISRLGKRNLGRDDRVISHWAKEARYPFLDEDVVSWALSAPLPAKCGFGQPSVIDDAGITIDPAKLVLRKLALKLGMPGVANEKKRAIQFGARTAKMEQKKTKGTHQISAADPC